MSLENVVVGDKLYTEKWGVYTIYTVKRMTKTRLICDGDIAFNKKTHWMVGGSKLAHLFDEEKKSYVDMKERCRVARAKLYSVNVDDENIDATEAYLKLVFKEG